jgi:hypothetical protein
MNLAPHLGPTWSHTWAAIWQSATLGTSSGAPISYSLKGAMVRGPMQPASWGVPRVPHVRGWLKAWARRQGRGAEVDAIEAWEQQQRQEVGSQLGLTLGVDQQLPVDEDY